MSPTRLMLLALCLVPSAAFAGFSAQDLAARPAFEGALTAEAPRGRFAGRVRLAQEAEDGALPPVAEMTREQLEAERGALAAARPELLTPIVMMSGGTLMAVASVFVAYAGLIGLVLDTLGSSASAVSTVGVILIVAGVAMLIGGVALVVVGIVKLVKNLREGGELDARLHEVEQQLQQLDRLPALPPAPNQVWAPVPARVVLARF